MKTKKLIGLWSSVAFAVGAMVGAGVFVLSGVAVHQAGAAAILSFLIAGIGVLCSAFSFMVIASLAEAGELGYAPVGRVLGHRFWGFLTSWAFYLSAIICTAFVLNAFGAYVHDFFWASATPLTWALIALAFMTLINLGNTSSIGRIEGLLVVTKVVILIIFIGFGIAHLHSTALHPFVPHHLSSIWSTSGLLFIAYLGFSVVTNIAGDVRDPRKTVPRAILLSILIVMALYIGVVLALLAFPLGHYDESSVGLVAKHLMGPVGGVLVPLAALVSTLSAANSNILGSSEIMVRLAARKDVPTIAGKLWHGHPVVSVLFGAVACLLLLVSRRTDVVIELANVAAIAAISLIDIAAIRLMFKKRGDHMRLVGGPLLPLLGLLSCTGELILLGLVPALLGLALVAAGGFLYLGRKVFHSPTYHVELVAELEKYGGPALRMLRRFEGHL
jgi:basic amino acid/polyamine antiporter, APA family